MKKVLTVLAVLVLLTGVVFAAETHKIKVKSDVGEQLPVFQLVYGSAITSSAAGIYTGNAGPYSDDTGIDVDFDLNENGSFIATAMINNATYKTKTTKSFTLTFSDGIFTVKRNNVEGEHKPTSITTNVLSSATGIASIRLDDVYIPNEEYDATAATSNPDYNVPATIKDTTATNKPVVITFNGTTMTADKEVATVEYAYTADPTIDPTAPGEFYYAYIIMTVTANM